LRFLPVPSSTYYRPAPRRAASMGRPIRGSDTGVPDVEGAPARLSAISLPDVAVTHRARCRARPPEFDQYMVRPLWPCSRMETLLFRSWEPIQVAVEYLRRSARQYGPRVDDNCFAGDLNGRLCDRRRRWFPCYASDRPNESISLPAQRKHRARCHQAEDRGGEESIAPLHLRHKRRPHEIPGGRALSLPPQAQCRMDLHWSAWLQYPLVPMFRGMLPWS